MKKEINRARVEEKEAKELLHRRKQLERLSKAFSLPVVLLLLLLVAFVDEIATASNAQVQSSVVNEFFVQPMNVSYNEGIAMLSGFMGVSSILMFIVPFYKTLADKFGRRIFLALNVVGMGVGLLICGLSRSVVVYVIGASLISFFIQHDMQIIYLYEIVPSDRRATIYGFVKALANISIVAVPLLRRFAMHDDPALWRNVFLVPAFGAFAIAILIFIGVKESRLFLEQRTAWLEQPFEERHPVRTEKTENTRNQPKEQKTGMIAGMKHLFKEKQLFSILLVTCMFAMVSPCIYQYVESIMYDFGMETANITKALMLYPFLYAMIVALAGFLSDRIGRKKIIVFSGIMTILGFAAFNISALLHASPYLVGFFYGLFLGCWWTCVDFTNMMSAESAPTYNRGSVAGAANLIALLCGFLGYAGTIVAPLLFKHIGFGYMTVAIPFVIAGISIMAARVRETKGVDLNSVVYEND